MEANGGNAESFQPTTLLEKAKEIDSSLARDNALGEFSESMWSNRCVLCFDLTIRRFNEKNVLVPYRDSCIKLS